MRVFDALRLAFLQIGAQRLKSVLTLLGVTVSVMFLIAVVSIMEGIKRYVEEDVVGSLISVNSFELRRQPWIVGGVTQRQLREWQRRPQLSEADSRAVAEVLPSGVMYTILSEARLPMSSALARSRPVTVRGVTTAWFTMKKLALTSGRPFSEPEAALGQPVAVIGHDIRNRYFPAVDPIDRTLRIGGIPYTVVGVAAKQGSVLGSRWTTSSWFHSGRSRAGSVATSSAR